MAKEASVLFRLMGRDDTAGPLGAVSARLNALRARAQAASRALGFEGVGRGFRGFFSALGDVRARLSGLVPMAGALGAGLSVAGFSSWMKGAAESADGLAKLGLQIGWTADRLAGLQYAFETTAGGSADQLKTSLGNLTRMMGQAANGIKGPAELFDVMNVRIRDANGAMRSSEDVLMDLADSMAKIKNPAERLAISKALFAEAGGAMAVMLEGGSTALRGAIRDGMGYARVTETLVDRSSDYNDSLSRLDLSFQGLRNRIAEGALPGLTRLADALTTFIQAIPDSLLERFNGLMGQAAGAMEAWFAVGEDGSSRAGRAIEGFMDWVERSTKTVDEAVESVGGWRNAFLIFGAALAGPFLVSLGKAGFAMLALGGSIFLAAGKLALFMGLAAGGAIASFIQALQTVRDLSLAIKFAWATNPIGLIVIGVAMLIAFLVTVYCYADEILEFFCDIKDTLFSIIDAMTGGLLGKALEFLGLRDDPKEREEKEAREAKARESGFEGDGAGYAPGKPHRGPGGVEGVDYGNAGFPFPAGASLDPGAFPTGDPAAFLEAMTAANGGAEDLPAGYGGLFAGPAFSQGGTGAGPSGDPAAFLEAMAATDRKPGAFPAGYGAGPADPARPQSGAGATMRALSDPDDLHRVFQGAVDDGERVFEARLADPDGLLGQTTLSLDRKDRERLDRGLPVQSAELPGDPGRFTGGGNGDLPLAQPPWPSVQAAAQTPPPKGEIVVRFDNAPQGTRIETRRAEGVDLSTDLNIGLDHAFSG